MRTVLAVLLSFGFFLAGCATTKTPQPRLAQFNEIEYLPYANPGTGKVSGQAFLRTASGDVKYAAGMDIGMNPVTTYSNEWYERCILSRELLEDADSRADKYHWRTIADGDGRFVFENLPAGDYYIATQIIWFVPGNYGLQPTGGNAYARVKVEPGRETRAIVTNR